VDPSPSADLEPAKKVASPPQLSPSLSPSLDELPDLSKASRDTLGAVPPPISNGRIHTAADDKAEKEIAQEASRAALATHGSHSDKDGDEDGDFAQHFPTFDDDDDDDDLGGGEVQEKTDSKDPDFNTKGAARRTTRRTSLKPAGRPCSEVGHPSMRVSFIPCGILSTEDTRAPVSLACLWHLVKISV
jgi:hypothetical protein